MRKMALFGTAMALVLTLAIVVPVFGAPPSIIPPPHPDNGHHATLPLAKGQTITISATGTAFKIGNRSITETASLNGLKATVVRSTPGHGMLNFSATGTLTIGGTDYSVVSGHGTINFHSHNVVLHLTVKNSAGDEFHLILYGRHYTSSSSGFTVDFLMPQSKLAHLWFLQFKGASLTTTGAA